MKLQTLTLIATATLTSLGAATPMASATEMNWISSVKRGIDAAENPEEFITNRLNSIVGDLRGFIYNDYFDFANYYPVRSNLANSVTLVRTFVDEKSLSDSWGTKLDYLQELIRNINEVAQSQQKMQYCIYWGSDLVTQAGLLNIKAIALNPLIDGDSIVKFGTKKALCEHDLKVLEDRANKDTGMSEGVRKLFDAQMDKAIEAIKQLKDAKDDSFQVDQRSCPAI